MKPHKVRLALTVALGGAVMCSTAMRAAAQTPVSSDPLTRDEVKFARIYTILKRNAMDPVDPDHAILDGGIRGMLSVLDPFSTFLDKFQFTQLEEETRGEAPGFGSVLYVQAGNVLVLETAPGSPSWRAGLGPGDEILKVNGISLDTLDLRSLIELLRRSRSHPVSLSVLQAGKDVAQDFHLNPANVPMPTVDESMKFVRSDVGYLHLTGFEEKTPEEVATAIERMGGNKLKGIIFDLRDNHGGLVAAAVAVAGLFLKPDSLVLTIEGRAVPKKLYRTQAGPVHFNMPMIVLVNGQTASAAEVLTATLQDHDRAVIAGEPTYGKGVVESVMPLSDSMGMALITAQYFTPSGRSIQRPLPGTELGASLELQRGELFHTDDGRTVAAGGGITPDVKIPARKLDEWELFLDETGEFTRFAEIYLNLNGKAPESFHPTAATLEAFKNYLQREGVRTPAKYWDADQSYLKLRIRMELTNLEFGLNKGNELETRHDPLVLKALALLPSVPQLLRGPKTAAR